MGQTAAHSFLRQHSLDEASLEQLESKWSVAWSTRWDTRAGLTRRVLYQWYNIDQCSSVTVLTSVPSIKVCVVMIHLPERVEESESEKSRTQRGQLLTLQRKMVSEGLRMTTLNVLPMRISLIKSLLRVQPNWSVHTSQELLLTWTIIMHAALPSSSELRQSRFTTMLLLSLYDSYRMEPGALICTHYSMTYR